MREVPSALKLHTPIMLCDNELGDSIPEPFPRKSFFLGVFGPPGGGKSSFMVSILTQKGKDKIYRGVFNTIYLIIPSHSLASIKSNVFRDHPSDQVYNELSIPTLQSIKAKISADAEQGFTSLIVIDDQTVHLKEKGTEALLRELVFNRRHYRTSIMILAQSYTQMPLAIRKCLSHFVLFKSPNKKEIESVLTELVFKPQHVINEVASHVFKSKHSFLFGVSDTGQLYNKFNKLLLQDASSDEED